MRYAARQMSVLRKTVTIWPYLVVLGGLSACGQLGHRTRSAAVEGIDGEFAVPSAQEPEAAPPRHRERIGSGKPYGQTRVRLQYFREDIEFDELHVDFDGVPDGKLRDIERDRVGFRADFGNRMAGGFFQLFRETFRAPSLLGEEFDDYGIGGGIVGAPVVDQTERLDFVVPYRFEVDLAAGHESVSGFDEDLRYAEAMFEVGFGARMFGLQASSGVQLRSLAARFDSDNPASPANSGTAVITGTNVGGYVELLYKHDMVPLMARVRGLIGDVSGIEFSFGFAF